MDLVDSLRALLRRWPLTLALLVVTLAATGGALIAIPWQYEAKSTVVFLSSRKGSQPVGGNPWLAFDGSLTITAEVVARGMGDERTLEQLKAQGHTAEFTVGLAQDSRGPLLDITATGPDPAVAQSTMKALTTLSKQRLADLQEKAGILPDATIRAEIVTASDEALLTPEKKIRLLVVIFAAGMLLTVGVPLFIESLAQKRRRLAAELAAGASGGQAAPPPGGVPYAPPAAVSAAPAAPVAPAPAPVPPAAGVSRPYSEDTGVERSGGAQGPRTTSGHYAPAGREDDGHTAPMRAIRPDEDIYLWPKGSERAPRTPLTSGRPGETAAREERSTGDGEPGDQFMVFDPTSGK
ncbi:hypothetical protein GCM10010116_34820 [Microbispora rosea subsp. aerata]|nr:hypothetical protein [Microbispora rosea]GGO17220.1 hypothetical protein GCM10010116_34820 [Microbispora rosea subsp. aerata]GIH56496.1 hypothetical protein Mro02_34100 [Microbispora rosea subsp. aerata]